MRNWIINLTKAWPASDQRLFLTGGLCDKPMGNIRGRAIKDFSVCTSDGMMTARCRAALVLKGPDSSHQTGLLLP